MALISAASITASGPLVSGSLSTITALAALEAAGAGLSCFEPIH